MQLIIDTIRGDGVGIVQTMDAKAIGARIVEARQRKGIPDYRELASRLLQRKAGGIPKILSDEAVRLWEAGKKIPPYDKIEQLAHVLAVSQEWLLFGMRSDEKQKNGKTYLTYVSEEEMVLITQYRQANGTGQKLSMKAATDYAKEFPRPLADVRQIGKKKL